MGSNLVTVNVEDVQIGKGAKRTAWFAPQHLPHTQPCLEDSAKQEYGTTMVAPSYQGVEGHPIVKAPWRKTTNSSRGVAVKRHPDSRKQEQPWCVWRWGR